LKEWRSRKRLCMSMINKVLEDWPGSKQDFLEQLGLETDEDVGVVIPQE